MNQSLKTSKTQFTFHFRSGLDISFCDPPLSEVSFSGSCPGYTIFESLPSQHLRLDVFVKWPGTGLRRFPYAVSQKLEENLIQHW